MDNSRSLPIVAESSEMSDENCVVVIDLDSSFGKHMNDETDECPPFSAHELPVRKNTSETVLSWETSTLGIDGKENCTETSGDSEAIGENREVIRSLLGHPSYWLSCTYRYEYRHRLLMLTIRQTGSQPNILAAKNFRRLTMEVKLDTKRKQSIVLIHSRSDRRFASSDLVIKDVSRSRMNSMSLKLKVFAHVGLMGKTCLCKWIIPLEYCNYIQQTEFMKYQF